MMKKKLISLLLAGAMATALLAGCGSSSTSKDESTDTTDQTETTETTETTTTAATEDDAIVVPMADATVIDTEIDGTTYPYIDEESGLYCMIPEDCGLAYIVPEGVEDGYYDIYIKMHKPMVLWGNTPFAVTVNGRDRQVQPIDMTTTLDAAGEDGNTLGVFMVAQELHIKAGDSIEVVADGGMLSYATPYLGDMLIYDEDAEVAVGFGKAATVPTSAQEDHSDPLNGKRILWIGSSVTFGMQASGYSMVDYMAEQHPGLTCIKYAISGTTLVDDGETGGSYVERLENDVWNEYVPFDLVVVQLSTNDATKEKPLGVLTEDSVRYSSAFDTTTVTGAEEYIINYVDSIYGCPVVFYTGTYYESDAYAAMVEGLKQVAEKYDLTLVDLYDDEEMTALESTDKYAEYMADDGIHPTKLGYQEWWGPKFDEVITEYLTK